MFRKKGFRYAVSILMLCALVFSFASGLSFEARAEKADAGDDSANTYLLVTNTGSANWNGVQIPISALGDKMQMETGKKYHVSIKVLTPDTDVSLVLQTGVTSWNWINVKDFSDPDTIEWTTLEGDFEVTADNAGETYFQVVKSSNGNNADANIVYGIDDFVVTDITDGSDTLVYSEDFEGDSHSFEGVASAIEVTQTVREPDIPQTSLVIDFEDGDQHGITGGSSNDPSLLTIQTATQNDGNDGKVLHVGQRTSTWEGPSLDVTDKVVAGYMHEISVWVLSESETAADFTIGAQIALEGGNSYPSITSKSISSADGWTKLSGTYSFTDAESYVVYVMCSDINVEFCIDDLEFSATNESSQIKYDDSLTPLKDIYADYFMMGNIFNPTNLDSVCMDLLTHHFDILTADNNMKPSGLWPDGDEDPTYTVADNMVATAAEAGLKIHGHTLAWHSQSPDWLNTDVDYKTAKANLEKYISNIAGHYAGKVVSWDVLNEAMQDNPSNPTDWRNSLRTGDEASKWFAAYSDGGNGWDYVYDAFVFAREADPNAVLYYNDYNLNNANKATAVASMVKELNEKYAEEHPEADGRKLIEGIGIQAHYSVSTSVSSVEDSIQKFIDIGVRISISELDVGVSGAASTGLTEAQEEAQALEYAKLFELFKKYSDNIDRVTFWGVDDVNSWRANDNAFACLFNGDLSAKEAYYAILDPETYVEEHDVEPEPDRESAAVYGTPVIGGDTIDAAWDNAPELSIDRHLMITNGDASGTARVLWDEDNLYVLFVVTDPVINTESEDAWEQDSVEVFFDENNSKATSYDEGMGQYRISTDNVQSFGSNGEKEGFESYVRETDGGYIVEVKVPFDTKTPAAGDVIGFDAQINDAGSTGARQDVVMWNDMSSLSYADGSGWGTLTLSETGETACTGGVFTDVSETDWFYSAVQTVYNKKLFTGTDSGTFNPNSAMTRAMFVTVLARLVNGDLSGFTESSFSDVAIASWYGPAVEWAVNNSVMKGASENTFEPDSSITVEQLTLYLVNYIEASAAADSGQEAELSDESDISALMDKALNAMLNSGAITEEAYKAFDPQAVVTRAEAAAIFTLVLDALA